MKRISYIAFVFVFMLLSQLGAAQTTQSAQCSQFLNSGVVQGVAPWYCSYINQAAQSAWSKWSPAAVAVIMVSFLIGVIILMTGIAMRNSKVRDFGVGEIYESFATALIVILFLAIAAALFGIIPSFVTGPINPYLTSLTYINNLINQTQTLDGSLFNVYVVDAYYVSTSIQVTNPESGGILVGNNVLSLFTGALYDSIIVFVLVPAQAIGDLLTGSLIVLHVEFYLLLFAMYASIPVFLIPGIIFRAFLPTRSIGGMLISTAIGFYMILPILFSVAYFFTNQNVQQTVSAETASIQNYGSGTGAQYNAQQVDGPLAATIANLKTSLNTYWIAVFFLPDMILAITYAMILTLAEFIGGMKASSGRLLSLI